MQSGTPLQSTAGAIQHSQSVIDYISKAVRHGQEIDQSFPVPNDVDIVQKICVEPVSHPDLQVAEGHQAVCRGGDTANNTSYKDKTCLSVSAKYNLALINQNLKHFVQTTNLQCFELPNFLNKGQKQKVKNLAYFYGAEARNCGRCGLTLFKTDHAQLPDSSAQSKIMTMLANPQSKGKAKGRRKTMQGVHKHSRGSACSKSVSKPLSKRGVAPAPTAAEVATEPLGDSNVGNKMLRSMGWSKGTGLGLCAQGQVDPVPVVRRLKRRGLGA